MFRNPRELYLEEEDIFLMQIAVFADIRGKGNGFIGWQYAQLRRVSKVF